MDQIIEKYIKCHQLASASACDGNCYECEFNIPENALYALEKLHEYAMENPL